MSASIRQEANAPSAPRILVVDDDPAIHRLIRGYLRELQAVVDWAANGERGLELMRASSPDVVLLDFEMPGLDGFEVLERIKQDPALRSTEVIFCTGRTDEEFISRCFLLGATDYVPKPFRCPELIARIRSAWERRRLMVELKQAARLDALTGLANRPLLLSRLATMIDRVRSGASCGCALMFLDFDRFKSVNDTLGHEAGDDLLRAIANRLRRNLRSIDSVSRESIGTTLARLGGDEFVVITENVPDAETAQTIAERLLKVLSEPYDICGTKVCSSASIGVVFGGPEYKQAEHMLRDADTAMYEAKARGKACAVLFSNDMQIRVQERHDLEADLRAAIGTDQLRMVYQPIVELDSGNICGVEALIRWHHPVRGLISPAVFIPIAEESRLILPMSEWILDTACRDFMRLHTAPDTPSLEYVSINLSRVQLDDPTLVDGILETLHRHRMRPDQCQLEITESEIMHDKMSAVHLLRSLKNAGVRMAMDDFGTGYSSLACLHEFPFDVIKVDRSFIASLSEVKQEFVSLVNAISSLADNLGMPCVAEGVETREQIALLLSINCRYGQGYYFGRPVPLETYLSGGWRKLAEAA